MSILTLCSIPKPFTGIYERLQHNALQNWVQRVAPEDIFLFGDEEGVAAAAKRYGCRHFPCQSNDFGTPIISDVFRRAAATAQTPFLAFVNADILLGESLQSAIADLASSVFPSSGFLGVSRRWNLEMPEGIDVSDPDSFAVLETQALEANDLYPPVAMDLFVFPKTLFATMPPFSIGWPGAKYDNWMLWYARSKGVPVVDMTAGVTLIHQNHPGFSCGEDRARYVEHWRNLRFAGGYGHCYDMGDATHVLASDFAVTRQRSVRFFLQMRRLVQRVRDICRFEWM